MKLKDRFSQAWQKLFRSRASSIDVLPASIIGRPLSLPAEYIDYAAAFQLIPDIYACVTLIQSSLAGLPLRFYRIKNEEREEILADEPGSVAALWHKANDLETGFDVVEQMCGGLLSFGNSYMFMERLNRGQAPPPGQKELPVREIYMLPPDRVAPIPGPKRTRAGYELDLGNKKQRLRAEDVVHIKNYDPTGSGLGLSVLSSLQLTYEVKRNTQRWQNEFYKQGATVAGHYSIETNLPEKELNRLTEDLKKRHRGPEKAFNPVILSAGMEYVRAGLTLAEMQFIETNGLTSADIFRAFKVPPVLLGVKQGGGLSDAGASTDLLLYWEQCIMPLALRITHALNEFFLPLFGDDIECEFDFGNVRAFQQTFLDQAKALAVATGAPCITRNEARKRLGLPPVDDPSADELLVPFNLTTIKQQQEAQNQDPFADPNAKDKEKPKDDEEGRQRAVRRARNDRDLSRFEREFAEGTRRLFVQQEERVVTNLRALHGERIAGTRVYDPRTLLTDTEADRELVHRLYLHTIKGRGQEAVDELALDVTFEAYNERVDRWIRTKSLSMLGHINDTTRKKLADQLGTAILNNETLNEQVARIREVFVERRAGQAMTIARTETSAAFNYASVEAWEQTGIVEEMEWLTSGDEHVRDAHADIDGDVAPVGGKFTMQADDGTLHQAGYPGDPALPAELAINCRCTLAPVMPDISKRNGKHSIDWVDDDMRALFR